MKMAFFLRDTWPRKGNWSTFFVIPGVTLGTGDYHPYERMGYAITGADLNAKYIDTALVGVDEVSCGNLERFDFDIPCWFCRCEKGTADVSFDIDDESSLYPIAEFRNAIFAYAHLLKMPRVNHLGVIVDLASGSFVECDYELMQKLNSH